LSGPTNPAGISNGTGLTLGLRHRSTDLGKPIASASFGGCCAARRLLRRGALLIRGRNEVRRS
jgi:hypothetical protein